MHSVLDPWGEDDPIVDQALSGTFDENETLQLWAFLASRASAGTVILDVGAYAGLFSLLAIKCNPLIRVAAFEATSVTYGRLVSNIILNAAETVICAGHVAAWRETTSLSFPHAYGVYTMSPGESALGGVVDHEEVVSAIKLDDLIASEKAPGAFGSISLGISKPRIFAMKIDVEGAEDGVLAGCSEILRQQRPFIVCELLTTDAVTRVEHQLKEFSYRLSQIGAERNYLLYPEEEETSFFADYKAYQASEGLNWTLKGHRQHMMRAPA